VFTNISPEPSRNSSSILVVVGPINIDIATQPLIVGGGNLTMGNKSSSQASARATDMVIMEESDDAGFTAALRSNMQRLILYAKSSDPALQKEVAERLANEAIVASRRALIVQLGGLELLVPLSQSRDVDIQRLAAHAMANLSVEAENQVEMAKKGALDVLVQLLNSSSPAVGKQAAKAVANLAVNSENKRAIAAAGGIPPLIVLAGSDSVGVQVEAVAALANMSVDDENEAIIGAAPNAFQTILQAAKKDDEDLQNQCARALRNLSCCEANKERLTKIGAVEVLVKLAGGSSEKAKAQATRALANLAVGTAAPAPSSAAGETT
jgi:hypothetical protein